MPKAPVNQNPDSRQGGEGTRIGYPNGASYDALTKSIGRPGDDHENAQPIKSGTK